MSERYWTTLEALERRAERPYDEQTPSTIIVKGHGLALSCDRGFIAAAVRALLT